MDTSHFNFYTKFETAFITVVLDDFFSDELNLPCV